MARLPPVVGSRISRPIPPSAHDIHRKLLQRLGYTDNGVVQEEVRDLVRESLAEALGIAAPALLYRAAPIEEVGEHVIAARGLRVASARWALLVSRMSQPRILLAYALTIGEAFDARLRRLKEDSLSKAFVFDAAGSEIVETVADRAEEELWGTLGLESYQRTRRFSPGYCDWDLTGQQALFGFLGPERIGVRHTAAWCLIPCKSITAVVIGSPDIPARSACRFCRTEGCAWRRDG
jgi:hypothetical protein